MEIKTKFNIGEKVFYTHNVSIPCIVKSNPFYTDKEIFERCYGEGFVVGIRIAFDSIDEKPRINYIISDKENIDDEYIVMMESCGATCSEYDVSNNREELEKKIHDIHIAELKILNEKIINLMK